MRLLLRPFWAASNRSFSNVPKTATKCSESEPPPSETHKSSRLQTGLELEFLGTSSAQSTSTRNVSCVALHFGGGTFLFDCGEGTVRQMIRSYVRPNQIDAVFITHLHGDHVYGLPGLAMRTMGTRQSPIGIHGPKGIYRLFGPLIGNYAHINFFEVFPKKESNSETVKNVSPIYWDESLNGYRIYENDRLTVTAATIKHTTFTLGYVIQEKAQRRQLLMHKLLEDFGPLRPGSYLKDITNPEINSVILPSGQEITDCSRYRGPPRRPRKIVILGDTVDPSGIAHMAADADVLVHEATNTNEERSIALAHGHSTAGMAGQFAQRIGAKTLILTHFSPRNFQSREREERTHLDLLVKQAKMSCPGVDFWRYPVPPAEDEET